ncbi:hypothetical protein ABEW00_17595 [Rossellomorea vietnamensis]
MGKKEAGEPSPCFPKYSIHDLENAGDYSMGVGIFTISHHHQYFEFST